MRIEQEPKFFMDIPVVRLNPYSNGMRIEQQLATLVTIKICLNPYSNGMRIERIIKEIEEDKDES